MAPGSRPFLDLALHRHHWWCYEQSYFQVHAVRVLNSPIKAYLKKFSLRLSLKHVADGGSLAEEVISTVRTAQAFGTQATLSTLYDTHIDESRKVDLKAAIWHGGGLAVFFFVIYSAYALC
jgi:ATP-binding cassette subfamily B (MDR/TAP) protein 1